MTLSNTSTSTRTGGGAGTNLTYLLVGGGIGATLALLFAPKPGSELRKDITDISKKSYDESLELAHQLRDHSGELFTSFKEGAGNVQKFAGTKFARVTEAIEEAGLTNGEDTGDNVLQLDEGRGDKDKGRQPANIL